jgi:hypothetical protein
LRRTTPRQARRHLLWAAQAQPTNGSHRRSKDAAAFMVGYIADARSKTMRVRFDLGYDNNIRTARSSSTRNAVATAGRPDRG